MTQASIAHYRAIVRQTAAAGARLVAVSKMQPDERVAAVYAAGCRIFGENYPAGLQHRRSQLADADLHFIGAIQRRKLPLILAAADWVQSVSRMEELEKIAAIEQNSGLRRRYLIQINLGDEKQKNGVAPAEVVSFYRTAVSRFPDVQIMGLMGLGPVRVRNEETSADFACAAELQRQLLELGLPASELSLGMSGSWQLALQKGATMVRVGSDLFGARDLEQTT